MTSPRGRRDTCTVRAEDAAVGQSQPDVPVEGQDAGVAVGAGGRDHHGHAVVFDEMRQVGVVAELVQIAAAEPPRHEGLQQLFVDVITELVAAIEQGRRSFRSRGW
ncbi:hypothetical protein AB0C04_20920 [Micromonospora sp. NPDC048909]|uniref:hypothetical protein n=1 Tax=Micromonospora sp. NPDC048909 TaxID=3155643 RepID=UPI0033DADA6A